MKSLEERFFEKVKKSAGCWEWTANKNNMGYGMLRKGKYADGLKLAHRISYEIASGEVPKGMWVLHKCDNPGCVNPQHLFLGDRAANVRDMCDKGRSRGGTTPDKAYAILWEWCSGVNRRKIAKEYGVSLHVVKDIATRRSWQSLSTTAHD